MRSNVKLVWIISGFVLGTGMLFACPTPVPKLAPLVVPMGQNSTAALDYYIPQTDDDSYQQIGTPTITIASITPEAGYPANGGVLLSDGVTIRWDHPGYYNVTVTTASSWWDTSKTPALRCTTATNKSFRVTVVGVKRVEFQWGGEPWVDITASPMNCIPIYSNISYRAFPDPASAAWPSGKPVWGGSVSGTDTSVSKAYSTLGQCAVSAECGNQINGTMCVVNLTMEDTSTKNFSPQLGETATLNVKLEPTPPAGGFPGLYFELEIVRILDGGGEQHIQWVDADPSTPGVIDLNRPANFSTLALTWNGIPDFSLDGDASQAVGPDTFTGVSASFKRKLPPVTAGKCVPPPLYYAVARLRQYSDQAILCRAIRPVYVPQVVKIMYSPTAMSLLTHDKIEPTTGRTIIAAFSSAQMLALKAAIPSAITAFYGGNVNIRCVLAPAGGAPSDSLSFIKGVASSPLGQVPSGDYFGNINPSGTAQIFIYQYQLTCVNAYIQDTTFVIPVSPSEISRWLPTTAAHEIGHLLGLVANNGVLNGSTGHHNKAPWVHRQIMNPGGVADNVDQMLWRLGAWSFKPLNKSYAEFVLPVPSP
jgi:hypothetical protein